LFDGADQAFDHGNATRLPHGAEALANPTLTAPTGEDFSTELLALIGNQMPRRLAESCHQPTEDPAPVSPSAAERTPPCHARDANNDP